MTEIHKDCQVLFPTQLTLSIDYHVLYNVDDLSLRPYCIKHLQFVVAAGLEPATSNLSGSLSNQLIYATICMVSRTRTCDLCIPNAAFCQLNYYHINLLVDPKGIEPSTLSLQGRNASLGTCEPIIFVGEEGFEPPAFLMYRIYSPTPIRHLSSSPKCLSQSSFLKRKR